MDRPSVAGPAEEELVAVLRRASQVDGPARLFAPRAARGPARAGGLLRSARGRGTEALLDALVGSLLEEVPAPSGSARHVSLTAEGIRFLVRHLSASERGDCVAEASPLYQPRLLAAWKAVASAAEQQEIQRCATALWGDLLQGSDPRAYERARAKELVLSWSRAQEPEVRRGLARAMTSLGLRQLGAEGERVSFSARQHTSPESLFPGDAAEIVEPGWALADPDGQADLLLRKATVVPTPPSE